MRIFTIGFTKKSAKKFFELLRVSGAKRVVDVRLNNVSQLAGFAKKAVSGIDETATHRGDATEGGDCRRLPALQRR
jgi:hypothetical protein